MKRQYLILFALIIAGLLGNARTYAQDNPYEGLTPQDIKVFDLFSKGEAFDLWKFYQDSAQCIGTYAGLYGKIRMYDMFNRPGEALQCLDSLFTYYPTQYPEGYYIYKSEVLV